MPAPYLTQKGREPANQDEICLFAQTHFRNQPRRFGIKIDDRRRHMYIIGKTGMGKSTMMENMILHDIYAGHGVGLVDPHGDFAEKIIDYIPSHRMNDVVYFNPSDVDFPIGFNILEVKNEEQKHLIAAGLMGTFKKIWPDVWSSRMEYILNNTLLALLEYPGSTLLGINRLLADKKFRKKVLRAVKDPVIKGFWYNEFENYEPRYQKEAVAPIQNKIGQFLSASVIRNMVAQVKSTVDIRDAMDSGKILVMNLSKGRIGEDNSRLLGGMLITKIQLSAMERVDMPEADRKDFFLYVDEFQNFATPSFANILSEARKYHLGLVMAHQYVAQLDEVVADAVFGNVGTIVSFRVGAGDAEMLAKEYAPTFIEEDIVNLAKYQILLKLMIDGVASLPFSAGTLPPIGSPTGSADKVIRVSRERYAKTRSGIEDKIMRWSGLEAAAEDEEEDGKKPVKPVGSTTRVDTSGKKRERKPRSESRSDKKKDTPKPKEKPVAASQPVAPAAEKEETISLSDLVPHKDTKAKSPDIEPKSTDVTSVEDAPESPVKTGHAPSSTDVVAASIDKTKADEPKESTAQSSDTPKDTPASAAEASTDNPPKKKRKRRRRRKSKSSDTTSSTASKDAASAPKPPPSSDTPITFD